MTKKNHKPGRILEATRIINAIASSDTKMVSVNVSVAERVRAGALEGTCLAERDTSVRAIDAIVNLRQ